MTQDEIRRLQHYLQQKLGSPGLRVRLCKKPADCAELLVGDEFMGLVYAVDDEGERSYAVEIAILDSDLDEA